MSEFGAQGDGAGEFNEATGIAVNQESGDVYLADTRNNRVEQFGADGQFVRVWGFGVSDGSEAFEICNSPGPCSAGLGGSAGGQLSLPAGIAIDNSAGLAKGDVYVEDRANNRIERLSEDGEFILAFGREVNAKTGEDVCLAGEECQAGTPGTGPGQFEVLGRNAIAVGPTGTVYAGDSERVQKFSSAGVQEGEIALPGAGFVELLAVDSSGNLYVLSSALEGIRKYDGTGAELGEARDPSAGGLLVSIALSASDELLVSDPVKGHLFAYDAAGAQRLSLPLEASAAGGIALNDATKAVYVINEPAPIRVLALPPEGPLILEGSQVASEVLPTSATLGATINPESNEETHYRFQYGTSEAYGSETPEEALTPGFEDQPVSVPVTGLSPNTTYHFRVVVENALSQITLGPDQTFTTPPAVSIDSESASSVTATSAKLSTELNPHGLPSEYHFEYGLTSSYEQSAPVPDANAGEGTTDISFSITIQGLKPQSVYHYRVVAHNALGTVQGEDRTFTTQGGEVPSLPDERAWEMVSPSNKHGVSLEGIGIDGAVIEAAQDGGGLAYIAKGPVDADPSGSRSSDNSQLLARREAAGVWGALDIATAHQAPVGLASGNPSEYKLFSADLSRAVLEPYGATRLSPFASERTPYRREANGTYTPLVYPGNVAEGTKFGGEEIEPEWEVFAHGVEFTTGTPDLAHVLLESPSSLVQGFEAAGQPSIYEWSEGTLVPVSVLPGGAPAAEEGTARAGNSGLQMRGAISADGRRVFFETVVHKRLYVRDTQLGQTLRIDASAPGVKAAEGGATFQLATEDGKKAFFLDENRLTKDSTARPGAPDLYECTIAIVAEALECELEDLSAGESPGKSADVQGGVLGADQSGRYVYFVAKGALTPGAVEGSCPDGSEEECFNLYAADTQGGSRRLVAVLGQGDRRDWPAPDGRDLGEMTARVSPNGRYVAFMSERSLTGYDNHDARSGERDEEVYLYDYAKDQLSCASCDPSGQRPAGVHETEAFPGPLVDRPRLWAGRWLAGSVPGWTRVKLNYALRQSRYLSNSGRLFFNSAVALVEGDTNATQDVYEYEPEGVGSCRQATGCVSLVSGGSSSEETAFLDASESGDDVFFITAAQLSLSDSDKAFDVYDAHVCTVAPGCAPEALGSPPPCISADACRSAPTPQPGTFGAPASSTFTGAGNIGPAVSAPKPKAKPKRAQLLAKALAACKKKPKRQRARCNKRAYARYGPKHAKKSSKAAGKKLAGKKSQKNKARGAGS